MNMQRPILVKLSIFRSWHRLGCLSTTSAQFSHQFAADMGNNESSEEDKSKKSKLAITSTITEFIRGLKGQQGRELQQTTLAFIDPQTGVMPRDTDIPIDVLFEDAPNILHRETKKLAKEISDNVGYGRNVLMNHQLYTNMHGAEHNEAFIEYEFKKEMDMEEWKTGSDSDWSEGYSKCDLYRSDRGTAIFEGVLNKRVVKDGRTNKAGWCSMISGDKAAFGRRRRYAHWEPFNHLIIKCRGDGRSYKVILHAPEYHDVTWGDSYSHPLHTHGGPYWQYEKIPFSNFFYTINGRVMDVQRPVPTFRTSSLGIVIMDRIDGPFRLEVGFVGIVNDVGHCEKFAYESYNTELYNPDA